jgi:hypothetical protein
VAKLEDLTFETERGTVFVRSVYLSGPMTGYDEFNFPAFEEAAATLRGKDITVYSPHEMDQDNDTVTQADLKRLALKPRKYFETLGRDIELLGSGKVDAGVFLPGWQASRGAKVEYYVLRALALPTLSYPSLEWLEYRPAGRRVEAPPL